MGQTRNEVLRERSPLGLIPIPHQARHFAGGVSETREQMPVFFHATDEIRVKRIARGPDPARSAGGGTADSRRRKDQRGIAHPAGGTTVRAFPRPSDGRGWPTGWVREVASRKSSRARGTSNASTAATGWLGDGARDVAGRGDERPAAAGPDSAVRLFGATGIGGRPQGPAAGGSAPGRQPATAHVQPRLTHDNRLLHSEIRKLAPRTIPTGLRPPAQGWRASAYLGSTFSNRNAVAAIPVSYGARVTLAISPLGL